jgi:hypothetical protein
MAFKFNPITGQLDLVNDITSVETADNFSYTEIESGDTVVIPEGQEMVHAQDLMVRGDLIVRGSTFQIIDETASTGLGWTRIPENRNVIVPINRVLFYFSPFVVEGNLMISGTLKEVA